ncbi:hypothetical protein F4782DRAFT_523904 [Xylaria castorea]|nr:hypothetical protein F4782DRAFT_523904 [Xylaria castorea]
MKKKKTKRTGCILVALTYVNPDFGASGTQPASPAEPPPTSRLTTNPKPPEPNPATESRDCYNSGVTTDRSSCMTNSVNAFYNCFSGMILSDSNPNTEHTLTFSLNTIEVTRAQQPPMSSPPSSRAAGNVLS